MTVTFGWAIAKTVRLIGVLLDGGWRSDLLMVETYLLAIVQLVVATGLYELFIGALDAPDWLQARSLEDLKKTIVDVLIVFIGVKGVERLVAVQEPIEALAYTGAVAILIAALSSFRLTPSRHTPTPAAAPPAIPPHRIQHRERDALATRSAHTSRGAGERTKHLRDLVPCLQRMAKGAVEEHLVDVVAATTRARDATGFDQILNYGMHGSLTDAHQPCDLSEANLIVLGDAFQHMGMVRQERPRRNHCRRRHQLLRHPQRLAQNRIQQQGL